MIKVTVQKNLIGLEDLLVGTGTVEQARGPTGSANLTITKINGSNLPYDETFSMREKFDALQLQIDNLPEVVDGNGNILTGLINTSALDLDLVGRIWRKEIDANTAEIYYDTELMFQYNPTSGNIYIPGGTDYVAADAVVTAAYQADDDALEALITALDTATNAIHDLDVGTGANNLVQLTADSKLPAVDGSLLTDLNIPTGVPIGTILMAPYSTVDTDYLECDGDTVSRTTYADLFAKIGTTYGAGDTTTTFNLPDFRGEFLRGWDNGKGTDVGRTIGSFQSDEIKSHTHTVYGVYNDTAAGSAGSDTDELSATSSNRNKTSAPTGGAETRPRNYAVMYQIKAL